MFSSPGLLPITRFIPRSSNASQTGRIARRNVHLGGQPTGARTGVESLPQSTTNETRRFSGGRLAERSGSRFAVVEIAIKTGRPAANGPYAKDAMRKQAKSPITRRSSASRRRQLLSSPSAAIRPLRILQASMKASCPAAGLIHLAPGIGSGLSSVSPDPGIADRGVHQFTHSVACRVARMSVRISCASE